MRRITLHGRRRWLALPMVAFAAVFAGGAIAAFPQDNVKLYTGCLTSGGSLVYVTEGDNPLQPCSTPKQVVKLSGGDITSLTVTPPLTGGGTNGALTIGLDASATLPSCSTNNAVPKWNLSTSRWTCGTDNDHTYTADDTTLNLSSSNVFSIASDYRVKNTPDCPSGEFAKGFTSSGTIDCAAPASRGVEAWHTFVVSANAPEGFFGDVAALNLPAGSYIVNAAGYGRDDVGGNDEIEINCALDQQNEAGWVAFANSDGTFDDSAFALQRTVTLSAAGTVKLQCESFTGSDHVSDVDMTAIKATIHDQ